MASARTCTLRSSIRGADSAWLEASISSAGRVPTSGWIDPRTGGLSVWGAIAIGIIRAELRRRRRRAARHGGRH